MMKKEYLRPELEMVDVKVETLLFNSSFQSTEDDGGDGPWGNHGGGFAPEDEAE